jgi:pimeloyl-ACP methyl ester carboxylesterase
MIVAERVSDRETAVVAVAEGRPSLLWEQRAALELGDLIAHPVYYGVGVPRGDGAPVLVLPGFLGSDEYLAILRGWLRRVGYRPYRSGIAFCAGSPFRLVRRMIGRAEEIAARHDRRLVIIGHSLGGVLGAAVARQRPELVEHVVTLGSPLCPDPRAVSHPAVAALGHLLIRETPVDALLAEERVRERVLLSGPLPEDVRLTCLYTREDAVVSWDACFDGDPRSAAHEVRGTHCGLAWNTQVYRLLGSLLARG